MNVVTNVRQDARCAGFTYITTQAHSEEGEWTARIEWAEDDEVWLVMRAVSRPSPRELLLIHPLMRHLQKRAHRRGIEHFIAQLQT